MKKTKYLCTHSSFFRACRRSRPSTKSAVSARCSFIQHKNLTKITFVGSESILSTSGSTNKFQSSTYDSTWKKIHKSNQNKICTKHNLRKFLKFNQQPRIFILQEKQEIQVDLESMRATTFNFTKIRDKATSNKRVIMLKTAKVNPITSHFQGTYPQNEL